MKRPLQLLAGIAACILFALLFFNQNSFIYKNNRYADQVIDEGIMRFSGADKQLSAWFKARAYPDPYYLNDKFLNAWEHAQEMKNKMLTKEQDVNTAMWSNIGPDIGIGGRVLCIAIDPTNGNNLFAGSASGGIWKSTNAGSSWSSVTTNLPVLGVSSIIINPDNPDVIYAGTGEVYRMDSTGSTPNPGNTGFNVWKTRGTYGIGIIKSEDGGLTWTNVMNKSTSELFGIQQLRFDPSNPEIVYACATDGLYRSTDAGENWIRLYAIAMCTDVVINGSNIMLAAGNFGNTVKGIFRSTNNGVSFSKLTMSPLPSSFKGFIKFGWVVSAPNTVVASIARGNGAGNEIFRSTNFGNSWTEYSGTSHSQWQYWFSNAVAINHGNTNKIVHAGVNVYQYTIGSGNTGIGGTIHDDIHDIEFDPSNSDVMYVCSDGGIYRTGNANNASPSFSRRNTGLVALQFYASFGVSRTDPNLFLGGLQDNGAVLFDGSWGAVGWMGGDGTACAIDPNNDNYMIASRDARGLYRSTNGGGSGGSVASYWGSVADSRTAFVAPIAYAPSNSTIVYCATDNLHRSSSRAASGTWSGNSYGSASSYIEAYRKTSIALAVSHTNANKVYVSTSPFSQYDNDVDNIFVNGVPNVLKTTTGGTPFTIIKGSAGNRLPDRYVMDFAISPTDDDSVFVALGGFGTSHVYVTGDGGSTWVDKGAGLPDAPFNAIMIDPINPKVIYAAGDMGVYVSPNRGNNWYDFNNGLPDITLIMDLQYTADNQLLAVSHGRGVFRGPRYTGTLPVEIESFTGEVLDVANKLNWKVGNEINVSNYELERSENNTYFTRVATIQANGSSQYNYTDVLNPLKSYYYRLKSIDIDGSVKYSGIVYLKRKDKTDFKVLGNPFVNTIDLKVSVSQNSPGQINLYDAAGKLLRSERYDFGTGMSTYSIRNLSSLPSGFYYLEAVIGNNRYKQKMVKN